MTSKVVVNLNIFCTLVEDIIMDNLNSTSIVTIDWSGS